VPVSRSALGDNPAVLAAALIVAGIAVVDSLNPGTIAPALVLAVSAHPVRRVLEFAAGFFVVNVAGGILIAAGLSALPAPSHNLKHIAAVVAGVALLVAAVVLLRAHGRHTRPKPEKKPMRVRSGSAVFLGAGLALAELPTAFPYFAAIAAIDAADLNRVQEFALIAGFNVLFLTPVLVIAGLIAFFPGAWQRFIDPFRRWMRAHWPQVLAAVFAAGGAASLVYGLSS
jgi:cytochrome c biogenesis protein CcdA